VLKTKKSYILLLQIIKIAFFWENDEMSKSNVEYPIHVPVVILRGIPVWFREYADLVGKYGKNEAGRLVTPAQAATMGAIVDVTGIRGGIRVPHIHEGKDIRVLNEKSWGAFSKEATKIFAQKIAIANTVSFDQLKEVADIAHAMPE
jgi:hypothetical protein